MVKEIKASARMKPCDLCTSPHEDGATAIEFDSCGFGKNTTINRVCIKCMEDIVSEYHKLKGERNG